MKKHYMWNLFVLTGVLFLVCGGFLFFSIKTETDMETGERLVLLNEIEQLMSAADGSNPAKEQIALLREELQKESAAGRTEYRKNIVVWSGALMFAYVLFVLCFLYVKILRPFGKLEAYAGEVAKGNLDISLHYERENFFGAFTWAFDHMRNEIVAARKCEENAIRENKTIIAALSHDIKTPIASIRAYAEGLEANLEGDYEKRCRYLAVIMKKCDEVTRLTNDLLLHSLSELSHLQIQVQRTDIAKVLEEILSELEYEEIVPCRPIPKAEAAVDRKRLAQVMENLIGNARKYAPGSRIDIWAGADGGRYEIHVRDHGAGIEPQDMPFLFDKFYRGQNVGDVPGSGLGLYIVKYIMNRMGGQIELVNHEDGLEAVVVIPIS